MKKIPLVICAVFFTFLSVNLVAQDQIELKRLLNPKIDAIFEDWSEGWTFDTYVSRSAEINRFDSNDSYGDQLTAEGKFKFKRFGVTKVIPFTAYIRVYDDGTFKIYKLCYKDENNSDCYNQ